MKNNTLWGLIYALPAVLAFYLLPLISSATSYSIAILYVIVPLFVAVGATIFGVRHGRDFSVAAVTVLLLFPSVFMFYNSSSSVYIIAYGVIAVVCTAIGARFHREK